TRLRAAGCARTWGTSSRLVRRRVRPWPPYWQYSARRPERRSTTIGNMPYVTARDGKRLFLRVLGRGQPFVLLHGFAMNSRHWLPFLWPFARRYQFILPDFRGFGR